MSKKIWIVGAVVVVVAAGAYFVVRGERKSEPKYRKEKVERGDVVATVTATGTLSAVTTVKVGSQVSGIISRLHVDFNSEVKKGQLLAELDPTPFQASVEQRRADRDRSRVELRNTELAFARAKALLNQQLLSQAEYDIAQANRDGAAESVKQAEAQLKVAMTNLEYTKITSAIDGVVVDRQIDVGQTVAASFQAPTLFTIAQDLTKMQVLTNLDEADIGRIRVGQEATFSVDAFPERPFSGAVSQIRLSPQTVQNVVTYPVVLDVSNPEGNLKPGMTANVQIPVDKRTDVLKVQNAALRFRPAPADVVGGEKAGEKGPSKDGEKPAADSGRGGGAPAGASGAGGGQRRGGGRGGDGEARAGQGRGGAPGGGAPGGGGRGGMSRAGTVYLETAEGKLKPVKVRSSITDGVVTAVESDELKEGDMIVVGLATARVTDLTGGGGGGGARPGGGGGRGGGPRF